MALRTKLTHRRGLTDKMKERIAMVNAPNHLGMGGLINDWTRESTREERDKLAEIYASYADHFKGRWWTVADIKNLDYETFGVFTNKALILAIDQCKNPLGTSIQRRRLGLEP